MTSVLHGAARPAHGRRAAASARGLRVSRPAPTGRRAVRPTPKGRRALVVAQPEPIVLSPRPARTGAAFGIRRTVVSVSAVAAIAGLSLTMLIPANAATLHASVGTATSSVSGDLYFEQGAQSFTVSSAVDAGLSTARDGYTATSAAILQARHEAKIARTTEAGKKQTAIAHIMAADVTSVGIADGDTTTATTGTLADVLDRATLEDGTATGARVVAAATKYVGVVPYVHGGATPEGGFDCSGLVMYVFAKFGISVEHGVDRIAAKGYEIDEKDLQPGDLVVYPGVHIGIYIGDGYMVDAPDVGRDVEVQKVWGDPVYVRFAQINGPQTASTK